MILVVCALAVILAGFLVACLCDKFDCPHLQPATVPETKRQTYIEPGKLTGIYCIEIDDIEESESETEALSW